MNTKVLLAHLGCFISAVIWGTYTVFTDGLLDEGTSPIKLSVVRVAMTSFQLSMFWAFFTSGPAQLKKCDRKDIKLFVLLGFLYFSFQIAFIYGMKMSGSELTTLMQCINPVYTLIFGIIVGAEIASWAKGGIVFLGVAGTGLISGASIAMGDSGLVYGVICFILEGCSLGAYIILTRRLMKTYSACTIVTLAFCSSLCFWVLATIGEEIVGGGSWPSSKPEITIVVLSSFFCGAVTYSLNAYATKFMAPSNVILYNGVQPTVACVLNYLYGSLEFVWWREGIGAALIYASLILAARQAASEKGEPSDGKGEYEQCPDGEEEEEDIENCKAHPERPWPPAKENQMLLGVYKARNPRLLVTPEISRGTSPGSSPGGSVVFSSYGSFSPTDSVVAANLVSGV